jgi:hypothetical protein
MKYMLLIYTPEPAEAPDPTVVGPMLEAYERFTKDVHEAGVFLGGDALQGSSTATTVQVDDTGSRLMTDGPYAETTEVLGGFYLLDVPDLDAALDWAARCPGARNGGTVEVRPIREFAPA